MTHIIDWIVHHWKSVARKFAISPVEEEPLYDTKVTANPRTGRKKYDKA